MLLTGVTAPKPPKMVLNQKNKLFLPGKVENGKYLEAET